MFLDVPVPSFDNGQKSQPKNMVVGSSEYSGKGRVPPSMVELPSESQGCLEQVAERAACNSGGCRSSH